MLHKCLYWFPQCCSLSLKIIIENIYLNWILASKVNPKCQLISALVAKVEQKLPGNRLKLRKWLRPGHHPAPPPLPVLHPRQVMQHLWGNPGKSCHDDFKAFLGTCPHKQEYIRTQVYVCRREIDNFYDVSFEPRFVLYTIPFPTLSPPLWFTAESYFIWPDARNLLWQRFGRKPHAMPFHSPLSVMSHAADVAGGTDNLPQFCWPETSTRRVEGRGQRHVARCLK